jgi:hypothetical protein
MGLKMAFKLFFAILINTFVCFAQSNIADILYPLSSDTSEYSAIPIYSQVELNSIIKDIETPTLPNIMCQFSQCDFLDSAKSKQFRKIDINGDGEMDIVFSTDRCSDEILNLIWIKQKYYYKFTEYHWGTIVRVFRNKNNSHSLLIRSGYCCGGTVGSYQLFDPSNKEIRRIIDNQFNTICEFWGTQFPKEKTVSKPFHTIHDKAPLRTSHEELNLLDSSRCAYYEAVYGNIIAEYVEGSTGKILSEYTDSKGEHWYFVLMDPKDLIGYNRFYNAHFSFKCGWINSKDIKLL